MPTYICATFVQASMSTSQTHGALLDAASIPCFLLEYPSLKTNSSTFLFCPEEGAPESRVLAFLLSHSRTGVSFTFTSSASSSSASDRVNAIKSSWKILEVDGVECLGSISGICSSAVELVLDISLLVSGFGVFDFDLFFFFFRRGVRVSGEVPATDCALDGGVLFLEGSVGGCDCDFGFGFVAIVTSGANQLSDKVSG